MLDEGQRFEQAVGHRGKWIVHCASDERWCASGRGFAALNPKLHELRIAYGNPPHDLKVTAVEVDEN